MPDKLQSQKKTFFEFSDGKTLLWKSMTEISLFTEISTWHTVADGGT